MYPSTISTSRLAVNVFSVLLGMGRGSRMTNWELVCLGRRRLPVVRRGGRRSPVVGLPRVFVASYDTRILGRSCRFSGIWIMKNKLLVNNMNITDVSLVWPKVISRNFIYLLYTRSVVHIPKVVHSIFQMSCIITLSSSD